MNNIKNKLNIVGRCYVKGNAVGGEILSFVLDTPISGWLDDFLFILTIPANDQKYAPAYCRLQSKVEKKEETPRAEIKDFTEVKSIAYLKENRNKKGDILVVCPKNRVFVDFNSLVVIATLPEPEKYSAPAYLKKKIYNKSKSELDGNIETKVIDDFSEMSEEQVNQIMEEIN